jgi:hypothetical protein
MLQLCQAHHDVTLKHQTVQLFLAKGFEDG